MQTKAEQTKRHLLEAATSYFLEYDFTSFTLANIAQYANVSKGGLLYHFQNKEALLKGVANFVFEAFSDRFYAYAKEDSGKGMWSRALIQATRFDLENHAQLNIGIMATSLIDQETTAQLSRIYENVLVHLKDDQLQPTTINLIRLSIDGLYYSQLFNIAPVSAEEREATLTTLMEMTR